MAPAGAAATAARAPAEATAASQQQQQQYYNILPPHPHTPSTLFDINKKKIDIAQVTNNCDKGCGANATATTTTARILAATTISIPTTELLNAGN